MVQQFRWHITGGACAVGKKGFLEIERAGKEECVAKRELLFPLKDRGGELSCALRFVIGKEYAIRLYDAKMATVTQLCVLRSGWIVGVAGDKEIQTGYYLTWFRGRPVVDPLFFIQNPQDKSYKTAESDVHVFTFKEIDFARKSLVLGFDDQTKTLMSVLQGEGREVAFLGLALVGEEGAGHIAWIHHIAQGDENGLVDRETFPVYWEAQGNVGKGFPDDSSSGATTSMADYRWLKCMGKYSWVIGHLSEPIRATHWELSFDLKLTDVVKETCLEMHSFNGTMAQAMIPIKIGAIQGRFFCGFASDIFSELLGKTFWKTQQAWVDEIMPETGRIYHIRIECFGNGYYSWWINDIPVKFSGIAKSGYKLDSGKYILPSYRIPYCNQYVKGDLQDFTDIGLHFGAFTAEEPFVCYYGNFNLRSLSSGAER